MDKHYPFSQNQTSVFVSCGNGICCSSTPFLIYFCLQYRAPPPIKTKREVDEKRITVKPVNTKACPHCARSFGPNSYDRHIEFCKEKAQRMSTTPVTNQLAKERLKARIQVSVSISF